MAIEEQATTSQGLLRVGAVLVGTAAAAAAVCFKAATNQHNHRHLPNSPKNPRHAYGTQAARSADLKQQIEQFKQQVADLQERLKAAEQAQTQLQNDLHAASDECANKDRRIEDLEDEAMRLQRHAKEAQQVLLDATAVHKAQVARLDSKHNRLIEHYTQFQRMYNKMLKKVEDTEVAQLASQEKAQQSEIKTQGLEQLVAQLQQQLDCAKAVATLQTAESCDESVAQSDSDGDEQPSDSEAPSRNDDSNQGSFVSRDNQSVWGSSEFVCDCGNCASCASRSPREALLMYDDLLFDMCTPTPLANTCDSSNAAVHQSSVSGGQQVAEQQQSSDNSSSTAVEPCPGTPSNAKGFKGLKLDMARLAHTNSFLEAFKSDPTCACIAYLCQAGGFAGVTSHKLEDALLHVWNGTSAHMGWSEAAGAAFVGAVKGFMMQPQDQTEGTGVCASAAADQAVAVAVAAIQAEQLNTCAAAPASPGTAAVEAAGKAAQKILAFEDVSEWWGTDVMIAAGAVVACGGPVWSVLEMQCVLGAVNALREVCGEERMLIYEALPEMAKEVLSDPGALKALFYQS